MPVAMTPFPVTGNPDAVPVMVVVFVVVVIFVPVVVLVVLMTSTVVIIRAIGTCSEGRQYGEASDSGDK